MALPIKKLYSYSLPVAILGLSMGGALAQNVPLLLIMVMVICVGVGLVGFGKLDKKVYPILLGSIGVSLLYQTTLYSPYMIGTDIHQEYYYFRLAYNGWDVNIPHNYNSALGITVLAPLLSKILHIDGAWVFKVIYPAIFSLTPVILYYAFRKILDEKSAFLSSFFFLSMPVWSLEAVSISKLQLAGPLLALMVFLGVSDLRGRKKAALAILTGVGLAVIYYTISFLLLLYLSIGVVFLAIVRVLPRIKTSDKLPLEGLIVTLVITAVLSLTYFGVLGIGTPLKTFAYYSYSVIGGINPVVLSPTSVSPEVYASSTALKTPGDTPDRNAILRAVTGLDFFETTLPGKLFRLSQLTTGILILLGIVYLAKNYGKIPEAYLLFVGVALLVLLLGALKPGFSSLMGMTRLYHASLYILAPLLVIGGIFLFKKKTGPVVTCGILIPYFLLTSGFVFEITKVLDIESLDLPYSIALSSYRIDVVGIYEKEDEAAVEYLISTFDSKYPEEKPGYTTITKNRHIYADLPGMEFLYEFPEVGSSRAFSFPQGPISNDSYVFLRKWNVDNRKITYGISTGLRKSYTYEEIGIDKLLEGRLLLYDGGAQIYGPNE